MHKLLLGDGTGAGYADLGAMRGRPSGAPAAPARASGWGPGPPAHSRPKHSHWQSLKAAARTAGCAASP